MPKTNYYFYIDQNQQLRTQTMTPIETFGDVEGYFNMRGIQNYWGVERDNPSSILNAVTSAISEGADIKSSVQLVERYDIPYSAIAEFADESGIDIKDIGDKYEVGDGELTATAGSALQALLVFFAPVVETDKSNDEEE